MARKIVCDHDEVEIPDGAQWMLTAPSGYATFADIGAWEFCSEDCVIKFLAARADQRRRERDMEYEG